MHRFFLLRHLCGPAWAATELFLAAGSIAVAALLPPPVALGSREELAEMDEVLEWQQQRTEVDAARIHVEDQMSLAAFRDVLGPWWAVERLPHLSALVLAIQGECRQPAHAGKAHFAYPRPPALDARVAPIVTEGAGSYPSSHSTRTRLTP